MKQTLSIIGTGNMAHFLGLSLKDTKYHIQYVYGRNFNQAKTLSTKINAQPVDQINYINQMSDVIFLCVNDNSISEVSELLLPDNGKVIVHCSGNSLLSIIKNFENRCVFWPIYSINKNNLPDHKDIPIVIQASNTSSLNIIKAIADSISNQVNCLLDNEREILHLLAVITNNFTTHLIAIAQKIANDNQLDFNLLKPILAQTYKQLLDTQSDILQTGPAIRNDTTTMQKHLALLKLNEAWQNVYTAISESIIALNQKDE